MILSGEEIRNQLGSRIVIDPFDEQQLNPNSYNLILHDELLVYEEVVLDMRNDNRVRRITIPKKGLLLNPNQLYLGRTVERTETHELVPMVEGRSSIGRLGLFVHVTAGFGDVGFQGFWTMEMFAVQPVRIYPGVPICQIFYHEITGDIVEYQSLKYQNQHALHRIESRWKKPRSADDLRFRANQTTNTYQLTRNAGNQVGVGTSSMRRVDSVPISLMAPSFSHRWGITEK